MTTQTTTIQASTKGMRSLIGATAAGLAVLGGALLWQARPTSETAAPVAATSISRMSEGVAPRGGLAELYAEQERAMWSAEVYPEMVAPELVGQTDPRRVTWSAEVYPEMVLPAQASPVVAEVVSAATLERMGGMAELFREQARERGAGGS